MAAAAHRSSGNDRLVIGLLFVLCAPFARRRASIAICTFRIARRSLSWAGPISSPRF
jgi:hypothetical protein